MALSTQIDKSAVLLHSVSSQTNHFFNTYYGQDRSLRPYLFLSCLLSVLFLSGLFIYRNIYCVDRKERIKQVIDIQLVSNADFQDKQDLLPATAPKPSLGKTTSPVRESRGELFAPPIFVIRSGKQPVTETKPAEENAMPSNQELKSNWHEIIVNPQKVSSLSGRYLPMSAPLSIVPAKNTMRRSLSNSDTNVNIEEVKPPELVEIMENEGDSTNDVWQNGGHSTQGLGTSSSLASYLRDLHKKLKHHWSPPSGSVRHIKVVFRLTKDGTVTSIQLMQSSGNTLADNSAVSAIKEAAPFGRLPVDYPHQFLDLAYTFNYTSDELTEIQQTKED